MLTLLALLRPNKKICNGSYCDVEPSARSSRTKAHKEAADGAARFRKRWSFRSAKNSALAHSAENPPGSGQPAKNIDVCLKLMQENDPLMGGDNELGNKNSCAEMLTIKPQEGSPLARPDPRPNTQYLQPLPDYHLNSPPPGVQEETPLYSQGSLTNVICVIPPDDRSCEDDVQVPVNGDVNANKKEHETGLGAAEVSAPKALKDPVKRAIFVRRVYTILLIQLLITAAAVLCSMFIPQLKSWLEKNPNYVFISIGLYIFSALSLCCLTPYMLRTNCLSVSVLIAITISLTSILSYISVVVSAETILLALGVTAVCVMVLTSFAFCCKRDLTGWYAAVTVFFVIIILFGLMASLLQQYIPILKLVYAVLGALVMCLYIVMDTQMLLGGKRHELDTDMHVFGAIMLYIDIITLFIYIMDIIEYFKK